MTFEEFIEEIGSIGEKEYMDALSTTKQGRVMILKRTVAERNINNYNKEWMKAWQANMDIQVAFDTYSVISYIVGYVLKEESGVTKALLQTLKQVKNRPLAEQYKALKLTWVTHRQVGASEAFYSICPGMHLRSSNIKCTFVQSGFPEKRSGFYMKVKEDAEKLFDPGDDPED